MPFLKPCLSLMGTAIFIPIATDIYIFFKPCLSLMGRVIVERAIIIPIATDICLI